MTREEIEELKGLAASMGLYDDKYPCKRAVILGKAIKALEQEPIDYKAQYERFSKKAEIVISQLRADRDRLLDVLDKIRTEIEQKARPNELGGRGNGKSIRYGLCMALEIIDKYKAESEE